MRRTVFLHYGTNTKGEGILMNDLLVALMMSNMQAKKGLEELLSELVYRIIDLEKEVKRIKMTKGEGSK
jgi:hypothetical protein